MAKKKRKKSSSIRRQLQSKELQKRVEKGRRNAEGRQNTIIKLENAPVWRPKDGEHIIDILPYIAGPNDRDTPEGKPTYTFEYEVHRGVGPNNLMFLCLEKMFGKPCPICEHRMQLIEQGADKEVWKPLFPKKRNLYNVIVYDRGEEEKGVQIWDEAYFYSEKNIVSISKKRGRGGKPGELINFSDVDNGKSISFIIEPPQSKEDYRSYTGFAFEDREYEIEDDLLEDCFTLDEIISIPDYDTVSEIYWGSKQKDDDESPRRKKRRIMMDDEEDEEDESKSTDELMSELDDCEDIDDLKKFVEENDIDYKVKRKAKFKKTKREIEAIVLEDLEEDDDEEDDDDQEEITWEDLAGMKLKALKNIIKERELDIDPDDADDTNELRTMVAEELDIDDDIPY